MDEVFISKLDQVKKGEQILQTKDNGQTDEQREGQMDRLISIG